MPKALCMTGMVIAAFVLIIFVFDLALGVPFGKASLSMDVAFVLSAAALGYLSWTAFREQD